MAERDGSDRRRLYRALRRAGWRTEVARSGHRKFWDPSGRLVTTCPTTASDTSSLNYLLRDLRNAGFEWPPRDKGKRRGGRRKTTTGGTP